MSFAHPKEERSIIPLFLTVFLDLLGFGIVIPVLAVVLLDPSIPVLAPDTPTQIRTLSYGLLLASFPLSLFFAAPIMGALSDRYGRKPTLFLSMLGTALSYVLFALGLTWGNLPLLFVSRVCAGIAGGNVSIAFSAIADISEGKAKTRNFGLVAMAFGLGFILGPYIGGKLADPRLIPWFDFATPFWFATLLTVLNLILCAWLFQETNHHRTATPISALTGIHNLRKAFTLPKLRILFLSIFLLTLGFNFFTQFFQVFLIERFHFTTGDIGDFFAYAGLWIALSQGLLTRPLSQYLSNSAMFAFSTFFLGITVPLLLLPEQAGLLYFIVPFLAFFYGVSQVSSTTLVSDCSDRESQGEIMGINQSIQSLGMAIPPIIAGLVVSAHITIPILTSSFFTLLSWLVFYKFFMRRRKDPIFHTVE